MAIQTGIISYAGKLGNTIGFDRKGKSYSRALNKNYQIAEESLKSAHEFGCGSTAAALTRLAFAPLLLRPFKTNLHNRLAETYRKVIRSGALAKKGKRTVFDGNVQFLNGFEFNGKKSFNKTISMNWETSLLDEELTLKLDKITWGNLLSIPKNAKWAMLNIGITFLNFNDQAYQFKLAPPLKINPEIGFEGGSLKLKVPIVEEQLMVVMANVFFESEFYLIDQKLYQAGLILDVLHLREGKVVLFEQEVAVVPEKEKQPKPDLVWSME